MKELIGRTRERAALEEAGSGIVLLAGEAGVGKTTLARAVLGPGVLEGFGVPEGASAYGPVVEVLRALRGRAAFPRALGALLPELGESGEVDRATLFEAIRSVLAAAAPLDVLLDDMQWADEATLTLLPALARALEGSPVRLVVAYRSDDVPRGHPIRRLRSELRRDQRLREVALEPFDAADTAALLERVLGAPAAPALRDAIADRTDGVPFFVTELGVALAVGGRLKAGPEGLELREGEDLPLPESVRDAVLLRAAELPADAHEAIAVAAVAGSSFEPETVAAITGVDGWAEALTRHGIVVEAAHGQLAFRHALVRDAFYDELPWPRRRALHRAVAQRLSGPPQVVAEHWAQAREPERARAAFLQAAAAYCAVHAYRDGARAARRALELWGDDDGRLDALERLAICAELAGEPGEAVRAWREVVDGRRGAAGARREAVEGRSGAADARRDVVEGRPGAGEARRDLVEGRRGAADARDSAVAAGRAPALVLFADASRRLAGALELQARWDEALAAREEAAVAFAAAGKHAEASAERLAAAAHLRSAASFRAALSLLELAAQDARTAARPDLEARVLALEGNVLARMGEGREGVERVRAALTMALDANVSAAAAEIYQRLADSLEHGGDYAGARATYDEAIAFCTAGGLEATEQVCLACLTVVLRQTGEWDRACALAREVLGSPASNGHARAASSSSLGVILALRGERPQARAVLLEGLSVARRIELTAAEILCTWGLALLAEAEKAVERGHAVLDRWERSGDRHYGIGPLRATATALARAGDAAGARACAAALATIAADAGQPEALSGLAHALGETALLDGEAGHAIAQFERALELLQEVGAPLERLETERRLAAALLHAGRRDDAVERLLSAYRLARRLRMRPALQELTAQLAELGEHVDRRVSRRQAEQLSSEGLTRRESDVLQLLAVGRTNREIAAELYVSPRTVDMHVRNILRKLDCRSRADAARRASELGLLKVRQHH